MNKRTSTIAFLLAFVIVTQILGCKKEQDEQEDPITGPPVEPPPTLVQVTHHDAFDLRPVWSPDGETLAFVSNRNGSSGVGWFGFTLWKIPSGGGTAIQIETGLESIHQAQWSPDGFQLVFYNGQNDPNWDIYTIGQTGGTATAVIIDHKFNMTPCFSPDGNTIAFAAAPSNQHDIYTLPVSGGTRTQITTHPSDDRFPRFSPDGTRIAFSSNRAGNFDVWIIDLADGTLTQLTSTSSNEYNPDWSPDGSQIAYMSDLAGNFDIFIIPSDGGDANQITTHTADDDFPTWSPDGSQIAFGSNRTGNMEIWTIQF